MSSPHSPTSGTCEYVYVTWEREGKVCCGGIKGANQMRWEDHLGYLGGRNTIKGSLPVTEKSGRVRATVM